MTASKIEWTDRSDWNPLRGCTRASEGCRNCYAEAIAGRFSGEGQAFHGFAKRTSAGGRWTGRVELVEDRLTLPLRWRKPARIFASSTSDIFHEALSDGDIDRMIVIMALAKHHTFQVLTKRAERAREYLTRLEQEPPRETARRLAAAWPWVDGRRVRTPDDGITIPLPNVWIGVSVEDQAAADARITHLLATPAAKRFLSCEPLLGPINLTQAMWAGDDDPADHLDATIDWVIAGGESGPRARPMHPDWARSLRDQCAATGTPFFFKQWGEWAPGECAASTLDRSTVLTAEWWDSGWAIEAVRGDYEFHADDEPDLYRVGKGRAGRLLDGVQHDGVPEAAGA